MSIIIVEDLLEGFRGDACLVKDGHGNYFVVSTITREQFPHAYGDIETLAFRANEDGTVSSWADVAGGGDMTRSDVLAQISSGDLYEWESEDDSYLFHDPDYLEDGWNEWVLENE